MGDTSDIIEGVTPPIVKDFVRLIGFAQRFHNPDVWAKAQRTLNGMTGDGRRLALSLVRLTATQQDRLHLAWGEATEA